LARAFLHGVHRRGGIASITAPDEKAAQQLAQKFQVRHVPFHNIYDTLADLVVIADAGLKMGSHKTEINPSYFRGSMTVIDLSAMPQDSDVLREARARGSNIVEPAEVFRGYVAAQFESITGKPFPREALEEISPK
jgi:3-dehydroquinate dehydratase / shikimate dehydrogenase